MTAAAAASRTKAGRGGALAGLWLACLAAAGGCGAGNDAALVRAGTAPRTAEARPGGAVSRLGAADAARGRAGTAPRQAEAPGPGADEGAAPAGDGAPDNPLDSTYAGAPAIARFAGEASYYHDALAGRATATGEPYEPRAYTAASPTLPFGTVLRVVYDGPPAAAVLVRVNDRGPCGRAARRGRRVLDLSRAAAERLGITRRGVAEVRIEVLARGTGPAGRGCHARSHRDLRGRPMRAATGRR
jgi:rare lipoprotein A